VVEAAVSKCNCNPKRLRAFAAIVPAVVLALLPKCPLCFVAYASALGIGLSVTTATYLRAVSAIACVVALVVVIVRARLRGNA